MLGAFPKRNAIAAFGSSNGPFRSTCVHSPMGPDDVEAPCSLLCVGRWTRYQTSRRMAAHCQVSTPIVDAPTYIMYVCVYVCMYSLQHQQHQHQRPCRVRNSVGLGSATSSRKRHVGDHTCHWLPVYCRVYSAAFPNPPIRLRINYRFDHV
jgi:hypothetical protein